MVELCCLQGLWIICLLSKLFVMGRVVKVAMSHQGGGGLLNCYYGCSDLENLQSEPENSKIKV